LKLFENLNNQIKKEEFLIDIIRDTYWCILLDYKSNEFLELNKIFNMSTPSILFVNKTYLGKISNENLLLILDEKSFNIDTFRETILTHMSENHNTSSNINSNQINYSNFQNYENLSQGDIIQMQKEELKQLERDAEMKKIKEKKEKEQKIKKEEEEKKMIQDKTKRKESLLSNFCFQNHQKTILIVI